MKKYLIVAVSIIMLLGINAGIVHAEKAAEMSAEAEAVSEEMEEEVFAEPEEISEETEAELFAEPEEISEETEMETEMEAELGTILEATDSMDASDMDLKEDTLRETNSADSETVEEELLKEDKAAEATVGAGTSEKAGKGTADDLAVLSDGAVGDEPLDVTRLQVILLQTRIDALPDLDEWNVIMASGNEENIEALIEEVTELVADVNEVYPELGLKFDPNMDSIIEAAEDMIAAEEN